MQRYKLIRFFVLFIVLSIAAGSAVSVPAQSKKDRERARKIAVQGDALFNKKDYRGAIGKYAEAIVVFPGYAAAHYWKAYAHYYLKENDQALTDFDAAIAKGYDKPIEIYRVRWFLYFEKGDYDAAFRDASEAARIEPKNANYQFALGDIFKAKKQYPEAIESYKRGLQFRPNEADVHYNLAESYANVGDYLNQGFAALDALKYKTRFVGESYFLVADALYRAKKYDEAIEYYERAINVKPEIYGAYIALSDIYRIKNRFADAVATAKKGIERYPTDYNLWIGLSWYYSLADRHQDAVIAAQAAIKLDSAQSMGYTNLCRALNDTKQYSQAVQACNSALRINPGDGESHLYIARAYEFLNQTDRAVDNYNKAITGLIKYTQENPDYSDGFYLLGNAYFALQKDNDAIRAYLECLRLAPNFARARYTLGYSYFSVGNKSAAREQYNLLLNLDPVLAEKLRAVIEK
ncbi:MAG: tetratricopeptide repeat protein [Acidobacteria bacterium]|nr:tetratricopeptide repeat protein [Acidobacteriota bacterium]